MLRDITLGQYYPGESWIHRLDPRVKRIATLVYVIALFIVNNLAGFAVALAALAAVIIISKVPLPFLRGRRLS